MLRVSELERAASSLRPFLSGEVRGIDYGRISELLGVSLPVDYKELADYYPTLEFDEFLRIPTPTPGRERDFVEGIFRELEILRDLEEAEMSEGCVAHPAAGGLIPWSESLSGDVFYWRVSERNPDAWPVVVNSRNDEWWEFPGGAIAFVVGLIDGSIDRRGLPSEVPSRNPSVRAFR